MAELALRYGRQLKVAETAVPQLQILREERPYTQARSVLRPSLCFLVQGAKEVTVGSELMRYHGGEFLFTSVELPVTGEVVEASAAAPYLCLVLQIDPSVVFELASASASHLPAPTGSSKRSIFVG